MLYVFNRNEEVVAKLENGNKDSCPYYAATVKSVLNGESILSFKTTLEHEDAKAIEEHGYIARKNKFNKWQLFLITELRESHDDTLEIEVTAEASIVELDGVFIENMTFDRKTPAVVLPAILAGTRWEVNTIEGTEIHDLTIKNKSVLWAIQKFRERWGVELSFEIEITANYISKRVVNCYNTRGLWKGKRFEYSKDLVQVIRDIEAKTIKTALYGIGREIEDSNGLRMDFSGVTWVKGVNGAPMDKPQGQKWLGDDEAKAIWGKKTKAGSNEKQHIFGSYETTENTDAEDLLWETWVRLQQVKTPNITYDLKVIDLYKILGLEPEAIELGDQGAVIDRDLNLELQARVIEYQEDLINEENDELVLGNFIPRFTDLTNQLEELNQEAYRAGDAIPPSWLDTQFSFAADAIRFGGGTVIASEGDGILIVDNPENPQKAIKLNAGQIALANSRDIPTNTFNWRNFGTGSGWLSDLVEVGKLRFERSEGGTLALGGPANGNGQLIVYNAQGQVIGDLDATKGGFTNLYVGNFTADNVLNSNNKTIVYSVHPDTGDDNNDGLTSATALRSVQEAINRIPKHNNGRVEIYIKDVVFNEYEIRIEGFFGSGTIAIYFNTAQHNGMLYIIQNVQRVELYNGFINQIYGTQYLRDGTVTILRTHDVYLNNMQVYSRRNVDFGVKVRASHCTIDSCNFYDATTAGVNAEYGGTVELINDNYGSGAWAGLRAVGTGKIAVLNNTAPTGTTNTEIVDGGEIVGRVTAYNAGTPSVLAAPPITALFPLVGARSWNSKTGVWNTNNNFIYQGELQQQKTNPTTGAFYTEYNGNWKGCFWFNNTDIIAAVTNRTVLSARLKLRRLTYGGFSGAYTATLWTTPTPITQAGTQTQPVADFQIGGGTTFRWGEDDYIGVPAWVIDAIKNGSYAGFMLYVAAGTNYMIFDEFAQLEITYQ